MKQVVFFLLLACLGYANISQAQMRTSKKLNKQQTVKKKTMAKADKKRSEGKEQQETMTLTSVSTNKAYRSTAKHFSIADPTINLLNQRASGSPVSVSSSGIVGMPKGTYGFANGKIFLRSTTATSSGTSYGSGAVGTGTTISGVGTSENAIGVNGKNPYAGPWLWGDKLPNQPISSTRLTKKKQ